MFAGHVITGTILSVTVTVKLHVAWLPAASFTIYVTVGTPVLIVYVPTWLMPTTGEVAIVAPVIAHVRVLTAQLSEITALGTTTDALHTPASSFCDMFPGQVITGTILSVTVTVKLHVAWLPAASFTIYVTVVTPVLKVYVPTWLMPATGEVAIVAPVIAHVRVLTAQLSEINALGTTTEALHTPVSSF